MFCYTPVLWLVDAILDLSILQVSKSTQGRLYVAVTVFSAGNTNLFISQSG
jgi:hypothetical protein